MGCFRTVLAFVLGMIAVEGVSRPLVGVMPEFQSIAFPPHQTIRYEARDFRFTASTNRLGFRGPEFPIARSPGYARILVLGNSFAYGWALEFEDTWPERLRKTLMASGIKVEVANLATPGTNPPMMMRIASEAIPLLKPDVVVIAALQGGAITTLANGPTQEKTRPPSAHDRLLTAVKTMMPGFVGAVSDLRDEVMVGSYTPASVIKNEWRKEAADFVAGLQGERQLRYRRLDPATIARFEAGEMNAPLVRLAIEKPDIWSSVVRSQDEIESGFAGMRDLFDGIGRLTSEYGAHAIVVDMPYGAYLGGTATTYLREVGFEIPPDLEGDRASENVIERAAVAAELPFVSALRAFSDRDNGGLFIPFDGHYSAAGARLFADAVAPGVSIALERAPPVRGRQNWK